MTVGPPGIDETSVCGGVGGGGVPWGPGERWRGRPWTFHPCWHSLKLGCPQLLLAPTRLLELQSAASFQGLCIRRGRHKTVLLGSFAWPGAGLLAPSFPSYRKPAGRQETPTEAAGPRFDYGEMGVGGGWPGGVSARGPSPGAAPRDPGCTDAPELSPRPLPAALCWAGETSEQWTRPAVSWNYWSPRQKTGVQDVSAGASPRPARSAALSTKPGAAPSPTARSGNSRETGSPVSLGENAPGTFSRGPRPAAPHPAVLGSLGLSRHPPAVCTRGLT